MPDLPDFNDEEIADLEAAWAERAAANQTPGPATFANPDHAQQLRGRGGNFVEPPAVRVLSDEALEALLDEVVEEAVLRKAGKDQDPLEYD